VSNIVRYNRGLHFISSLLAIIVCLIVSRGCLWADSGQEKVSAAVGQAGGNALTLDAAISEALKANPTIQAGMYDIEAAQRQVGVSKGHLYGELDAVATAQHLNDPQLLRPMSKELASGGLVSLPFAQDQLHVGAIYTYPLYVGGQIMNHVRIDEISLNQTRTLLAGTRQDVIYNVTSLFAQARALAAQAEAIQRDIDALEATRRNLELAVKIGKRPEVDLLKTVDRISEAEAARTDAIGRQQKLIAVLMSVMGRDPAQPAVLAALPDHLPQLVTGTPEMQSAASRRSSVAIAELAEDKDKKRAALARGALDPAVSLQASYLQNVDPSSWDQWYETWFVGMQVTLPVFDGGSRRSELSRIRAEAKAARERLIGARLQAASDLQSALAGWRSSQDQLQAADAQYASAHEVARIEQVRFDTGAGDIEDLLRARSREVAAESAQIAARAQIVVSAAQINHVTESEAAK